MAGIKHTKEQLETRLNEIKKQLGEVNEDERIELETDMEEQAIAMENHEVSVTMEANLHKELVEIEEQLEALKEQE
jgi:hypothetical protein